MIAVWETAADLVRTPGGVTGLRRENGFLWQNKGLCQHLCTSQAGCRSGALQEAGEGQRSGVSDKRLVATVVLHG